MKKLKGPTTYLRNQTWKNLGKAALCVAIFVVVLLQPAYNLFLHLRFGFRELAFLLVSLIPLAGFYFFLGKYRSYKGGLEGEKRVVKQLASTLNDDYFLLSGVTLKRGHGDVDQIVIGPNGLFVVETKNWSGKISCNGDNWQRSRKQNTSSPSKQLKRNISQVKAAVEHSEALKSFNVPVEGVLVFANTHAELHLNKPTVPVVRLNELAGYITQYKARNRLTGKLPSLIGAEILKGTR